MDWIGWFGTKFCTDIHSSSIIYAICDRCPFLQHHHEVDIFGSSEIVNESCPVLWFMPKHAKPKTLQSTISANEQKLEYQHTKVRY